MEHKKSLRSYTRALGNKNRQRLTLPGFTLVPSARVDLTSLFGLGRGDPHRYSHLKVLSLELVVLVCSNCICYGLSTNNYGLFQYR